MWLQKNQIYHTISSLYSKEATFNFDLLCVTLASELVE